MNTKHAPATPLPQEWEADLCAVDPDNYWIDRATLERVNATTGARTPATLRELGEE